MTSCTDQQFVELFSSVGATQTARELGISERKVYQRRRSIEKRLDRVIIAPTVGIDPYKDIPGRLHATVENGTVLIGSDAHYWPGIVSTSHRAFVKACRLLKPEVVIMNGDVFDGAGISRHPPIGWEDRPSVIDEIETCKERLGEIIEAAPKAKKYWPLGNHDARFETRLASVAAEYAQVHGVHLKDHFPEWLGCWSVWINDEVVVKHRWKGGTHATHNNTKDAGKSMVTGHLHSLKVTPWTDYTGTRWGVDTGTLAATFGPQFNDYSEDSPRNWREGFAVLTFVDGQLQWPEVVYVIGNGKVGFRGRVWDV